MRTWHCTLAILVAAVCFAQGQSKAPVAIVGGQSLDEQDLLPLVQGQLRQLRVQEYEVKRRALDELINQKLVEAEAKKKGLTSEEFLRQEVDAKLADPTDAELEAFYLGQRNQSNVPFEQVKNKLLPTLKQRKTELARQAYVRHLRQASTVTELLRPPKVEVSADPTRVRGNPNALVTIVEFADFQCPYCRSAVATLEQVMTKYKDQVRLAFRDYPLRQIHPQAQRAAEGARCAGEQGKFWAYHDLLFANQEKLADADLRQDARSLGLNPEQFGACLDNGKYRAQIDSDLNEGMQAGVAGTPGFFINGVFLNGAQPPSAFESIIDAELVSSAWHAGR
jgi:protein-disulfide isomerase